jgi:hypothetical protein
MSTGPYSEPAESSSYPHIPPPGKNVHGIARKSCNQEWHVPKFQHVSSLCVKSSSLDLFIFIFEGSPESKDCLVIKKIKE